MQQIKIPREIREKLSHPFCSLRKTKHNLFRKLQHLMRMQNSVSLYHTCLSILYILPFHHGFQRCLQYFSKCSAKYRAMKNEQQNPMHASLEDRMGESVNSCYFQLFQPSIQFSTLVCVLFLKKAIMKIHQVLSMIPPYKHMDVYMQICQNTQFSHFECSFHEYIYTLSSTCIFIHITAKFREFRKDGCVSVCMLLWKLQIWQVQL